jgi:hypothetical protein
MKETKQTPEMAREPSLKRMNFRSSAEWKQEINDNAEENNRPKRKEENLPKKGN